MRFPAILHLLCLAAMQMTKALVFFVPLEDVSEDLWSALFCCLSKVVRCEEERQGAIHGGGWGVS